MRSADLGSKGEHLAQMLWPRITLVEAGSVADFEGTDAMDGQCRIQIKTDSGMRDRIFHEKQKRNGAWASFGPTEGGWRDSPSHADDYIFIGPAAALRVPCSVLNEVERAFTMTTIRPHNQGETARGYLVSIRVLQRHGIEVIANSGRWCLHGDCSAHPFCAFLAGTP